jgi:positive regulator of sigma E activity
MRETGRILKKDANSIEIEMSQGYACSGCNACFIDKDKGHILRINQEIDVKPGEQVEVEVQPVFAIKSAMLLFFMPLVMLVLGYFIFMDLILIQTVEMPYRGILGAIFGLIFSFILIYFYDRYLQRNNSNPQIRIVKITGKFTS